MNKPKFGQWVKARAYMYKGGGWATTRWTRIDLPIEGIYIGQRTVKEGKTDYGDYWYFTPTNYIKVWLIVVNEHENPKRVLPEDIRLMPECQNCSGFITMELNEDGNKLEAFCDECDIDYKPSDFLWEHEIVDYQALGVKVE